MKSQKKAILGFGARVSSYERITAIVSLLDRCRAGRYSRAMQVRAAEALDSEVCLLVDEYEAYGKSERKE